MKKFILPILIILICCGTAFYFMNKSFVLGRIGMSLSSKPLPASKTDKLQDGVAKNGKKILIAYFSWGGNTRKTAQYIHSLVGGDIVEIRTVKPYPEGYRATVKVGKEELDKQILPEIDSKVDTSKYDMLIIGYPIWYYKEPLAIDTFLKNANTKGKVILPFATSGGSTIEASVPSMQKYAPEAKFGEPLLANDKDLIEPWLKRNGALYDVAINNDKV